MLLPIFRTFNYDFFSHTYCFRAINLTNLTDDKVFGVTDLFCRFCFYFQLVPAHVANKAATYPIAPLFPACP